MNELAVMSGMSGASMLRTRRKDVNVKPNRKLDRKSSRGMLYENEELRLRTININAEVERGQSDIKKLKRENDQLKREISALRYEYDKLDHLLRERRSSPEQSDDSGGCEACAECAGAGGGTGPVGGAGRGHVAFNELSVVPEEDAVDYSKTPEPCSCGTCANSGTGTATKIDAPSTSKQTPSQAGATRENQERPVDVLVHSNPPEPVFFQSLTSDPYHVITPPPPGFVLPPPKFHTGGNVEDLLGEVQTAPTIHTTVIENSVFMCNTRKITQKHEPCCCKGQRIEQPESQVSQPKSYVTEKNIELNYDYPKTSSLENQNSESTTTEVASTVVFVERRLPARPKKFDFLFRSRSAPVGDSEEPIYATVKKLPKRLNRIDLTNLEREVAYPAGEPDSSIKTELTVKTDSERSQIPHPDDDTSRSEKEKSPQRQDTAKAKKRRRFSLTFKKRDRKRKEPKHASGKNGTAKNGHLSMEGENERLIEASEVQEFGKQKVCRHRARNTMSSCSSGPRYKRDSYQEMTSHSEHERTSVSSSMNSMGSACTHRSKMSPPPQDSIPWCGCWGAGCL